MKPFKSAALLVLVLLLHHGATAQACYIPKPMTPEQVARMKGVWKGSYRQEGKEYPFTLSLYRNNNTACEIEGPPVAGAETGEQIRFCDGGEFHFKKLVGRKSYEFQGTPKEGKIEGLLTIREDDKKMGTNGRFTLVRQPNP